MKLALLPALAVVTGLATVGCSDDGAESPESRDHLGGGDYSVLAALGELPASIEGEQPLVMTGDLDQASEVAGIDRPTDAGDDAAVQEWTAAVSGVSDDDDPARAFAPVPEQLTHATAPPSELESQVGWSVVDVDAFAAVTQPPDQFLVVSGDFDASTLNPDLAEVEDGILTDVEGEDGEPRLGEATALSRLGIPTRIAQQDGRVSASTSTEAVRDWLDEEESLADDDAFAALAVALDTRDVYSAVLTPAQHGLDPAQFVDLGEQLDPEQIEERLEQLQGQLPAASYDTVAVGWSADDDGALVSTAYHFASEQQAEDSVESLRELYETGPSVRTGQPYAEYLEVADVSTEGPVVIVTSRPTDDASVSVAYQMLLDRETLFVSR